MITKNTRVIPELAFLYLRPERLQMESYISGNIEGTYNVTFQLKACVTFFFFLVYPAIKKKKSSLRPCKETLGELRAPGRTVAELKVTPGIVHSRRVRL